MLIHVSDAAVCSAKQGSFLESAWTVSRQEQTQTVRDENVLLLQMSVYHKMLMGFSEVGEQEPNLEGK